MRKLYSDNIKISFCTSTESFLNNRVEFQKIWWVIQLTSIVNYSTNCYSLFTNFLDLILSISYTCEQMYTSWKVKNNCYNGWEQKLEIIAKLTKNPHLPHHMSIECKEKSLLAGYVLHVNYKAGHGQCLTLFQLIPRHSFLFLACLPHELLLAKQKQLGLELYL